jgi:hypothetical protein
MILSRGEWGALSSAVLAVGCAGWTFAALAHTVDDDRQRLARDAENRWTALVQGGLTPDSATQTVLADVRARAAGEPRPPTKQLGFTATPSVEAFWQASNLNPLRVYTEALPRSTPEWRTQREGRTDLRLALAAAAPVLRRRREGRARQRAALACAWTLGVLGVVAWRARRRHHSGIMLQALRTVGAPPSGPPRSARAPVRRAGGERQS